MKTTFRLLAWIMVWTILPAMIQSSKVQAQENITSDYMVSDLSDYFYNSPQLSPVPSSTMEARVVYADSGNFMVMYAGYNGLWSVYGQVYDRNGNEIGETLEVQRNTSEQINFYYSSLSSDITNQFGAFLPGMDSMMVEKISGTGEFVGNTIVLKPDVPFFQTSSDTSFIYLQQVDPSVHILLDTIYLAWVNANEDISYRQDIFANIQKWMVPDVTG